MSENPRGDIGVVCGSPLCQGHNLAHIGTDTVDTTRYEVYRCRSCGAITHVKIDQQSPRPRAIHLTNGMITRKDKM